MQPKTIVAALLAALIVTAGATGAIAAPGNAPDDAGSQGDDHTADQSESSGQGDEQMNETASNHSGDDPKHASANENGSAAAGGERGPPVDMPAHVPDHVVRIHELIRSHIAGDFDMLGAAISGVVSNGGASADQLAENADGNETATPTPMATPTPA